MGTGNLEPTCPPGYKPGTGLPESWRPGLPETRKAPGTPGGKPAIFSNPLFFSFLTLIISTAPWTRSKRFPAISRFYHCLSGNFMGKFRREMKKQLGRRAEWPGWRPRWRATWQSTDSWHPSSRAAGTIQAGLGHLPRIAEPGLAHMPLILGRRDPEASVCVHPLSLTAAED